MKKYTFILAIGAMLALTACGSGSTATETTDSTAAPVADTTAVTTDSTTAPTVGGEVKEDIEKPVSNEEIK